MRRVLTLPVFRRLAVAFGLNELATQIASTVLVVLVYRRTESAATAAGFFLCTEFAPALIGPYFVARLDLSPMRPVLTSLYAMEGLVFMLLAAGVSAGFPIPVLLALALIDGVVALTSRSLARTTAVALTSPLGLLREGNAITNGLFAVCYVIGPALGGLILLVGSTSAALILDSVIFLLIAVILGVTRDYPSLVPDQPAERTKVRAALAYVRRDRNLGRFFGLRVVTVVFFTISIPVEVVLAQQTLHTSGSGYAVLLTAWGAGSVLGSAIYAAARQQRAWIMLSLGALLLGLGYLVMALSPTLAVAGVGAVIGGAGNGIDPVTSRTVLQEATDQRWMALVMALNDAIWTGVPGAGILIGGAVTALAGPRAALGVAAVGSLLIVLATPVIVRPMDDHPTAAASETQAHEPRETLDHEERHAEVGSRLKS